MKILVLTFGDERCASTQYRFVQFAESLREQGVELDFNEAKGFRDFNRLPGYDLVVVQKRLANSMWVRRVRKGARKLIYDTDDAIWEPHSRPHSWWTQFRIRRRLKKIAAAADVCTTPNEQLAMALRPLARRVDLVPMALNETLWQPAPERQPGPVRIGWSGAPQNLPYLTRLSPVLANIQKQRPGVEVVVFCGAPPVWTAPVTATHHHFKLGAEPGVVQTFDIGLLPLPDNAFAAGKSPIKALQYAACAVPCVASPVGATKEIVRDGVTGYTASTPEEWEAALLRLVDEATLRRSLGDAARAQFLRSHTRARVQEQWLECWRRLLQTPQA